MGSIFWTWSLSLPLKHAPSSAEEEKGLVSPEPAGQRVQECRAALASLEAKSKKGLYTDSLQTVFLCLCGKTVILFLEQQNICISLICKLGLYRWAFFYYFVHGWLFCASFCLMRVTPIHILWIQDIGPLLTVASFISLISVIQHFKLSFWILFML